MANHKMNLTLEEIKHFIKKLKETKLDLIICPTAIYAPYFIENDIRTGLQNIYYEDNGAYTGEISAVQASSLGAEYVIIGHSERRHIFNETAEEINKKIKKALDSHLKVIFCIGETFEERENYQEILLRQITEGLKNINDEVIIAYEPVWAIGSGQTPTNEEITEIAKYIQSLFSYDVKILYGGSVNINNINTLKAVNEVTGYLIGGASTKIDELIKIGEVVS